MKQINNLKRSDLNDFKNELEFTKTSNALDMYQSIATKSAIYPGHGTPIGLAYVALKGAGEAGEFAEHVGKAMRDDDMVTVGTERGDGSNDVLFQELTSERKDFLIKEIGDQLWYLAAKCNELGVKLSDVAVINIEKLVDRTERNALQGSGDAR